MNTIEKNLIQIGKKYQEIMETYSDNLTGICYHSATTLTDYFLLNKYKSKVVVGNLALINNSDKYLVYGDKMNILKEQNIGPYHAWCEVVILDKKYIVDPSIKFNKTFLKKNLKIKLSKNIPNIIVTTKNNYYWKYEENKNLKKEYEHFLNNIPNGIFDVKRVAEELRNKTFDSIRNIDLYNLNSLIQMC